MAGFGAAPFGVSPFGQSFGSVGVVLYPAGREGFLDGTVAWTTPTVNVALVRGYAISGSHQFVSDVTTAGGALVATATLVSKTTAGGVADAGDPTFTAVAAGAAVPTLVLYQASAVTGGADVAASAQRLIGYIDGLPITPNGADIVIAWSADRNRIFML